MNSVILDLKQDLIKLHWTLTITLIQLHGRAS